MKLWGRDETTIKWKGKKYPPQVFVDHVFIEMQDAAADVLRELAVGRFPRPEQIRRLADSIDLEVTDGSSRKGLREFPR